MTLASTPFYASNHFVSLVLCYSCVLIELFSEGKVPFTLSQLLSYRNGDYSPWKILDMVSDRNIKVLSNYMLSDSVALFN